MSHDMGWPEAFAIAAVTIGVAIWKWLDSR